VTVFQERSTCTWNISHGLERYSFCSRNVLHELERSSLLTRRGLWSVVFEDGSLADRRLTYTFDSNTIKLVMVVDFLHIYIW
jgi:hypothetical protein